MKIQQDSTKIPEAKDKGLAGVNSNKRVDKVGDAESPESLKSARAGGYSVDLSEGALETKKAYEKAHKIAMATPAVREDRVNELRERINSGKYEVDSGKVADGILREAVKDHLASSN